MSAIAGIVRFDQEPADREIVGAMVDALSHRGPDGRGVWTGSGGSVALGHCELRTTREHSFQPLQHATADLVLVADARIDNRRELLAALRLGLEASDAEIILEAYRQWGDRCVRHLVGDFAFVIWDGVARTLFCARDPMGVKPFHFVCSSRRFAFASELKALLLLDDVSRALDDEQVALFLEARREDRDRTIYRDVQRLPAAHTMTVGARGATPVRYWDLREVPELRLRSDDEYVEAFRSQFTEAVQCRLRSVRPVGATLSGGLDSSSIVCTSRTLLASPLHTFSLVFPDLAPRELRLIDERAFMQAVIRGGGVRAHEVRGDHVSPLTDLERMLWHLDEPFFAPNLYLHWAMFGAARAQGVGVLLDGFDGDAAVSHGLGRLDSLARAGAWDAFEQEARGFADHRGMPAADVLPHHGLPQLAELARRGKVLRWASAASQLSRRFGLSRKRVALEYGLRPLVPSRIASGWRSLRGRGPRSLVRPTLRRRLHARVRADRTHRQPLHAPTEREGHILGLEQPLYQATLELADKAAAAFGLEARYPFFDSRLLALCVSVPEEQKFAGGWSRFLFRRSMEGILPPEIQWRGGKGNLSANFFRRFSEADGARFGDLPLDYLEPWADMDRIRSLSRSAGASAEMGREDAMLLFRAAVLACWLAGPPRESRRDVGSGSWAAPVVA